jgi:CubicO group peptidase (beta-lactamase class C family)
MDLPALRFPRLFSLFPFFLLLAATIRPLPADDPANSGYVAELQATLAKRLPADGPGTTVLVARDGKILFSQAYGLADREKKIPAAPDTQFRIGSVTKQFTAAAILHLAEENRLSIEDPLAKYFPTYPGGDKITLHQLLNHTSGLHNLTENPDFMTRVIAPISSTDLLAWFQNDPPDFPPGEQFRYCNTGYVLLGQIVEKVSGLSYNDYLQKQFFVPLGMHDTGVYINATPPPHASKGYSYMLNGLYPAKDWDMSWAGAAGNLYSTAGDLWRWTEALQEGRVLNPDSLKTMITEGPVLKKETLTRYGMGLYQSQLGWLPIIAHNGGINGFLSVLTWFPDQKVTIAVLSNAMPPQPNTTPEAILPLAAGVFLAPEIAARAPKIDPTADLKKYPEYVGRYDYHGGIQEITTANGHLYAQLTGQSKFEIFPSGPDAFFFKVTEAAIVFDRDSTGAVTMLSHTQHGMTFNALKLAASAVNLSDAQLDAFVGQYQYGPVTVLTVIRRDHQLYAQLTGQPEFAIFPKSDHEFFWSIVPASVEFVRGPDGKVTGAIHHQNGGTIYAPKLPAK